MSVKENLDRIRSELAGIQSHPVALVGVTKFQPVAKLREAVEGGLRILGNNYAQEGQALMLELPEVEWHFIGHIQSRKVKYLTDYRCVQSLDRLSVAVSLSEGLVSLGRALDVLVEVNVGNEPQKSGIEVPALPSFLDEVGKLPGLRLRGLMGMPPPLEPAEARRPFFRKLRELFDSQRGRAGFDCLSMGTSADYVIAAQEGSTMVRLGTVLFGERPKKQS